MDRLGIKLSAIVMGLLWAPTVSLALPNCPFDQTKRYHNCSGTFIFSYNSDWAGDKYVGEFKDDQFNGKGTYTYRNGDKYVGEFKDDQFNGKGTYTYRNGDKYVGEFKDNKFDGQGTFTIPGGVNFVGEFKNSKKNGFGVITEIDGNQYIGGFQDDEKNGPAFYVWTDGRADFCFYVGMEIRNCSGSNVYDVAELLTKKFRQMSEVQRKNIQLNLTSAALYAADLDGKWGRGTFTALASYAALKLKTVNINTASSANNLLQNVIGTNLSNDNSCPSDLSADWHNCIGISTYDDGSKYVGEWKDNQKHGQGTYTWPSGSSYVGNWKDDKQHGQGTYTHQTGGSYVGDYKDGKRHGQGTMTLTNGDKYVGDFKDDKFNGQGTYTFGPRSEWAGDQYVGDFKDDNYNGQGTYTLANGDKYVGDFKDDKFNGQGTYTLANGDKYVGDFKDGNFNGQGTYTFGPRSEWAGDQYVGEWRDDKKHGQGTYIFVDGTREIEIWENGEFQGAVTSPKVAQDINPDETREVASGTGFYVSDDGHIITNHHVIDGCMDIKVQIQGELIPTIPLAEDKQNDLALLKVSQKPPYVFALSNDSPYPLQEIIVAGFPFGDRYSSTLKFTKGIVSSLAGLGDNYSEIQIDAALQQGNSGGPILDEYGNVVAVAVSKLDAKYMFDNFGIIPENINFGVKSSAARNLLEANRVNLKTANNKIISKKVLSSIAADGTVYLTCWMTTAQLEQMKSKKVVFQNLD